MRYIFIGAIHQDFTRFVLDGQLLVQSQTKHGITLVGPTRTNNAWQAKTEGAYTADMFVVDWEKEQVTCPQGKIAPYWAERIDRHGIPFITVDFRTRDCNPCPARELCTRKKKGVRRLKLQPRDQYLALQQARLHHTSSELGEHPQVKFVQTRQSYIPDIHSAVRYNAGHKGCCIGRGMFPICAGVILLYPFILPCYPWTSFSSYRCWWGEPANLSA